MADTSFELNRTLKQGDAFSRLTNNFQQALVVSVMSNTVIQGWPTLLQFESNFTKVLTGCKRAILGVQLLQVRAALAEKAKSAVLNSSFVADNFHDNKLFARAACGLQVVGRTLCIPALV